MLPSFGIPFLIKKRIASSLLIGLEAYFAFENDLVDATGKGHSGTPRLNIGYPVGLIGQQVQNTDAGTPNGFSLASPVATGLTWSTAFWLKIKPNPGPPEWHSEYGLIIGESNVDGLFLHQYNPTDPISVQLWVGNVSKIDCPATQDTRIHVIATFDGTNARIYINNTLAGSAATAPSWSISKLLAADVSNSPLRGGVDELGIWTRVLSSLEMTQLYNSGAGITYTNLL